MMESNYQFLLKKINNYFYKDFLKLNKDLMIKTLEFGTIRFKKRVFFGVI